MAKEVKQESQEMTREQLLEAAQNLSTQNDYMKRQLEGMHQKLVELSNFAMFKRLDYLFEVVKNDNKFPRKFTEACVNEIVETMTPPLTDAGGDKEEAKKEE